MLQIQNQNLFNQIVSESLAKVQNDKRWTNAIRKAIGKVEDPCQVQFMTYLVKENQLVIFSQGSDKVYSSNGICQCEAYLKGFPCWHRALARVMRLYTEAINAPTPTAPAKVIPFTPKHEDTNAVYFKTQVQSEKIAGFRI